LLDAEGEALLRTAVALGKSGDAGALRMAIDRLMPPIKERFLKFDLPPIESVADLPMAIAHVVKAVSKGELTPSEGTALTGMLGTMRSAFALVDLAGRLEAIERQMPGASTLPNKELYQ
jgi:hypothetical protein